jgi:hypothetical protein
MRKPDFDIRSAALLGTATDLDRAARAIERHRWLLQEPGVLGMWAGARGAEPYIMLAVREDGSTRLSRTIPDSLEGISVYYIEGNLGL